VPLVRTRLAVGLVSLALIALELTLMRLLSLRWWDHFAYMVISVALLGFGASGTALTLLRRRLLAHHRGWLAGFAVAFAVSIPASALLSRRVELDVAFLAWDPGQVGNVLLAELLMFVPFFLAGCTIGLALMDRPERVSGHYAANLAGSGAGGVAAVALMSVLEPHALLLLVSAIALAGAVCVLPRRRVLTPLVVLLATGGIFEMGGALGQPAVSEYKTLPQVLLMPDARVIHRDNGPLGRIDAVAAEGVHHHPGLALEYAGSIPEHVLLTVDGDAASAVYDPAGREDWRFKDYTTAAAAYHMREAPTVCVVGSGGGSDIGLAVYHQSPHVTALEMNPQMIRAMTGPLAARGGRIYQRPEVEVICADARKYFSTVANRRFDVIQIPPLGAFAAGGAGLYATQESYLYTVESVQAMLGHLSSDGLLVLTRWAPALPPDGVKAFDTAAEALRGRGKDPARHLAMLRNLGTVTILVSASPLTGQDADALRRFCEDRGFDLCYLPGLRHEEANRFHKLESPYYFEAAQALLSDRREAFLEACPFDVGAPTDNRPYFFHFFRWKALPELQRQAGGRTPALLELGYLMLLAALAQAVLLGALLIVAPLAPWAGALRGRGGRAATLGFFLLLGAGFMLLEMSFLQRLVLYLGHPIYSAAAVISGFLVFAGLGSQASRHWPAAPRKLGLAAGLAVAALALAYLLGMDGWLSLSRAEPVGVRFAIAVLTVAPLAAAMGHVFPTGLRQVAAARPQLVPWAWAANGFASVVATVSAPLLAMHLGFGAVSLIAVGCYAAAAGLCTMLPARAQEA
jgi:hypothetical protein